MGDVMTNEEKKTLDELLKHANKPIEVINAMPDDLKNLVNAILARQSDEPTNVRRGRAVNFALEAIREFGEATELQEVISADLKKTYGVDPAPEHMQRIAGSVFLLNALAEEIRQLGHKVAPMYGGNLARKATRIANDVVGDMENELGLEILKYGLANGEVQVVGVLPPSEGGDGNVG